MLFGLATGGLWRVLWYSLALALIVSGVCAALRALGVSWERIRYALIGVYGAVYVWWFFANGIIIDRISVLWSFAIFLCVASVGRPAHEWLRTGRDLSFFVAMWIAYDESRGVADGLGMPIQVESIRNLDRLLFFGRDPVIDLQDAFHRTEVVERMVDGRLKPFTGTDVQWYDIVGSCIYYSHFIVPPVVIGVLWFRNRDQWVRYMRRFATLLFVSCLTFILLPTAPPWMASRGDASLGVDGGALPSLSRHTGAGWLELNLDGFVEAWDTGRDWANRVAAVPSLHSAFALFVVVFFWPFIANRYVRFALLAYPLAMAIALAYFAEHYIADALIGWLYVGGSFLLWNRIERAIEARRRLPHDVDEVSDPETDDLAHQATGDSVGASTR